MKASRSSTTQLTPPHLNITSLLLSLLIGEVAEPLAGHPQQVHQLGVMWVGHEHFHKALHKPCAMLVVPLELQSNGGDNLLLSPQTCIARNGWIGYDHILPGGSEAVWNQITFKSCGDFNIGWRKPGPANVSDIPCNPIQCLCSPLFRLKTSFSRNFKPCICKPAHVLHSFPLLLLPGLGGPLCMPALWRTLASPSGLDSS